MPLFPSWKRGHFLFRMDMLPRWKCFITEKNAIFNIMRSEVIGSIKERR